MAFPVHTQCLSFETPRKFGLKGRLLVLTRGATAIDALVLAGLFRHMAVLAIEPADTLPNAAPRTKPAAL